MTGKDRIDLAVDPPPDLAIEIDVTLTTRLSAYEALQVPEIWRYQNRKLPINVLQAGYVESHSPTFPDLLVLTSISQHLEMSRTASTAPAIRAFRRWVRKQR